MHPLLAVVAAASLPDEVLVVDGDEANHPPPDSSSSSSTMYHHHQQYHNGKKTNHHHHHVRQGSSFPEMEMDEKTVQRNLQLLERQQGRMKQQQQQQEKEGEGQEQTQQQDPNKTLEKEFKTSDLKYRDDTFDFDKELEDVDEDKLAFYGPPLPPPGGPFPGYGAICPYRCMHSILHARRCKAYFPTCGGYFGWCALEDELFLGGYDGY